MPKIGLEIHAYLNTKEKLFCSCLATHGAKQAKPNTNICPICTGQPGSKPMNPNKEAIDKAIQIGLILNCKINSKIIWKRKHYNWPDLPKGYQNTISGAHAIPNAIKGNFLGIGITECHLEEDPAAWNPQTGEIDYNRSGSPLIEIVTEPEFTSAEQVAEWLKQLKTTLSYIKAIDKEAGIKADVNISLPEKKGQRVELKNINSIRNIIKAIETETQRQIKEGIPKIQETRRFNEQKNKTELMRTKEQAEDYRFISEPDLPQINIPKERIEKIKKALPETPHEKLQKLVKKHKIPEEHAKTLSKKLEIVEFFERVLKEIKSELATPWTTNELLNILNYNKVELEEIEIQAEHFIELLKLVEEKIITELKAQEILRQFVPKSFSPKKEIDKHSKISEDEIKKIVKQVIKENKKAVEDYKSGQQQSMNFLVGQVMKLSNKRADFKTARDFLEKEIK